MIHPPLDLAELFRVAVGVWSIQPSQFWGMTMREFWWLFDARKPRKQHVGGLSDADMDELREALDAAKKRYGLA